MPGMTFDYNPASHFTTGAVGQPGKRTFYLQGAQGRDMVTLVLEKEQVAALATGIIQLLEQLDERGVKSDEPDELEEMVAPDMRLRQPLTPAFRVGQMGLGYDEGSGLLVVVAQEVVAEGMEGEPSVARFWVTRRAMKAFTEYALKVVSSGRPNCPLCGEPMNLEGHFCVRRNGHNKVEAQYLQ